MRCPACNAENPEGAATCASCGAALGAAPAPAAVAAPDQSAASRESAAAAPRRRLSKLAVFAIVAAAVAPWLQLLTVESGGSLFGQAAADNWKVLMVFEYGAYALFAAAIITSLIALAHVLGRQRRRGGALAVGALLLAIGGMAASIYGPTLGGRSGAWLIAMGGGTDRYRWQTTAMIVGLAVVSEIVLAFVRTSPPAPKREPEPAKADPTSRP